VSMCGHGRRGRAAAACRSCHSVSSLQTSLRLSRVDKKLRLVSHASAFVMGCGQGLSYGAESCAPHSWHSALRRLEDYSWSNSHDTGRAVSAAEAGLAIRASQAEAKARPSASPVLMENENLLLHGRGVRAPSVPHRNATVHPKTSPSGGVSGVPRVRSVRLGAVRETMPATNDDRRGMAD